MMQRGKRWQIFKNIQLLSAPKSRQWESWKENGLRKTRSPFHPCHLLASFPCCALLKSMQKRFSYAVFHQICIITEMQISSFIFSISPERISSSCSLYLLLVALISRWVADGETWIYHHFCERCRNDTAAATSASPSSSLCWLAQRLECIVKFTAATWRFCGAAVAGDSFTLVPTKEVNKSPFPCHKTKYYRSIMLRSDIVIKWTIDLFEHM